MMSHSVSSFFARIALTMFVTACAGPATQAGSAGLPGMWHGSFVRCYRFGFSVLALSPSFSPSQRHLSTS